MESVYAWARIATQSASEVNFIANRGGMKRNSPAIAKQRQEPSLAKELNMLPLQIQCFADLRLCADRSYSAFSFRQLSDKSLEIFRRQCSELDAAWLWFAPLLSRWRQELLQRFAQRITNIHIGKLYLLAMVILCAAPTLFRRGVLSMD